jgi:hypothetical protein
MSNEVWKQITDEDFDTYEPGEVVTDLTDADLAKVDPRFLWTVVDDGENVTVISGNRWLNRVAHYTSGKPVEPGVVLFVEDDGGDEYTWDGSTDVDGQSDDETAQ